MHVWDKFQIIHSMYKATTCRIKLPRGITEAFPSTCGVKQGDVLSSLYIFINDLVKSLDISVGHQIVVIGLSINSSLRR